MKDEIHSGHLSYKKIFIFWYPLALTWLMMAVENPYLTSIIARLPEPKYNLAAFGVAFSFALIIEAPIIMLMSASTALVTDKAAFFKMRRFTYTLNFIITGILLIIILPPVFNYIARDLIGLPDKVATLTHISSIILLPWPAAIGYRRFYQGIMIRFNLTRRVAYGTIARLVAMSVTAVVLFLMKLPGAYVGAGALSVGVVFEAVAGRFMAHGCVKRILVEEDEPVTEKIPRKEPLTYRFILKFYYPLALMTVLSLGVHPLVTFFVGKSRFSIESLAVLPVINALVFLFRSLGLSFTEVAVALLGKENRNYIPIRNFCIGLTAFVMGGMCLIAFTPLATVWYGKVSGLSAMLTEFAIVPTYWVAILPGLTVVISLQRGVLMNSKKTSPISWATLIEVSSIILIMQVCIIYFDWIGAIAATMAFTLGRLLANAFLAYHQRQIIKQSAIH